MTAYIVAMIDIQDPQGYEQYGEAWDFRHFTEEYGGEFLIITDQPDDVLEGAWAGRLVVMKFPDRDKARGWYDSPEYRDVRSIRWAYSTANMALLPGFDVDAALAARTPAE